MSELMKQVSVLSLSILAAIVVKSAPAHASESAFEAPATSVGAPQKQALMCALYQEGVKTKWTLWVEVDAQDKVVGAGMNSTERDSYKITLDPKKTEYNTALYTVDLVGTNENDQTKIVSAKVLLMFGSGTTTVDGVTYGLTECQIVAPAAP